MLTGSNRIQLLALCSQRVSMRAPVPGTLLAAGLTSVEAHANWHGLQSPAVWASICVALTRKGSGP